VDADPKYVVALGAARAAAARLGAAVPAAAPPVALAENAAPAEREAPREILTADAGESASERAPVATPPAEAVPHEPAEPPLPPLPPPLTQPPPPSEPARPPPRPKRSRRRLIAAAAVLAVAAGGAVAAIVAIGGNGGNAGNGGAFAGWISPCPAAGVPAACITSVSYEGGDLAVAFTTQNVDAAQGAFGDAPVGTVFFLAPIDESQATALLAQGRTNAWLPWGLESPFTGTNSAGQQGLTAADIGSNATALCVLLGDTAGRVALETGNCAQLPPEPGG
jgi:hypothetical protein